MILKTKSFRVILFHFSSFDFFFCSCTSPFPFFCFHLLQISDCRLKLRSSAFLKIWIDLNKNTMFTLFLFFSAFTCCRAAGEGDERRRRLLQSNTHRLIHRRPLALAHIASKNFELESASDGRKLKSNNYRRPLALRHIASTKYDLESESGERKRKSKAP